MPTSKKSGIEGFGSVLPWLFVALALLLATGCERCSRSTPLARLAEKQGHVHRDRASAQENWLPAELGAEFQIGDAIFTKRDASAVLTLDDGSRLGLEEETILRFLDHAPGSTEQRVDLEMGAAFLEAGEKEAVLHTTFGQARIEAGGRVLLSRAKDSLRFEVLVGSASIENVSGDKIAVELGQAVEVSLGSAQLELLPVQPPTGAADTANDSNEQQAPAPDEGQRPISAEVRGKNVRIRTGGGAQLEPLAAGRSDIAAGSTLEVGPGSSVEVTRGGDRAELASGGSYVIGGPGGLVEAKSGKLRITSEHAVQIAVPGGFIVTKVGSATIEALGRQGTRVTATAGEVTLQGKTREVLGASDVGTLAQDGTVAVEGRGPERVDVEVHAGQSVTVHDPRPPTAIRVLFDAKCRRGSIHFSGSTHARPKSSARGTDSASFVLPRGTVGYSLHCLDEHGKEGPAAASGKLTVLMDAGTRPVPKTAPSTGVDVDGRSYTVVYQNLLPKVSLRWPRAPEASQFKLHVQSVRGSRVISTSQPSYTFPSGSLGEGTHTFHFEGGGRVSRQTAVSILFDNAAATLSLSGSAPNAGQSLALTGTALPGWKVTVDGKPVGQDAEGRFSVHSVMPESGQPAAVVLTHPTRGTHIYLRRPPRTP